MITPLPEAVPLPVSSSGVDQSRPVPGLRSTPAAWKWKDPAADRPSTVASSSSATSVSGETSGLSPPPAATAPPSPGPGSGCGPASDPRAEHPAREKTWGLRVCPVTASSSSGRGGRARLRRPSRPASGRPPSVGSPDTGARDGASHPVLSSYLRTSFQSLIISVLLAKSGNFCARSRQGRISVRFNRRQLGDPGGSTQPRPAVGLIRNTGAGTRKDSGLVRSPKKPRPTRATTTLHLMSTTI